MRLFSKTKPRVVNYVSPEEMDLLRIAARKAGLKTPSQIVGTWLRQKLTAK